MSASALTPRSCTPVTAVPDAFERNAEVHGQRPRHGRSARSVRATAQPFRRHESSPLMRFFAVAYRRCRDSVIISHRSTHSALLARGLHGGRPASQRERNDRALIVVRTDRIAPSQKPARVVTHDDRRMSGPRAEMLLAPTSDRDDNKRISIHRTQRRSDIAGRSSFR